MLGLREHDCRPGTYFRADRISLVNGQYYFATREGTLEGPYRSRDQAEAGIRQYIAWMSGKRRSRFFKISDF